MKRINRHQVIGIGIVLIALTASQLFESMFIEVPSGIFAAVGTGLILKWIPFKKGRS